LLRGEHEKNQACRRQKYSKNNRKIYIFFPICRQHEELQIIRYKNNTNAQKKQQQQQQQKHGIGRGKLKGKWEIGKWEKRGKRVSETFCQLRGSLKLVFFILFARGFV